MFVQCVSVKPIGMFHRERVTFLADPSDMHRIYLCPVGAEDVDTSVKILGIFQRWDVVCMGQREMFL